MSVTINHTEAVEFVRQALRRAVPGVTFTVESFVDEQGRPGLRARSDAPGYGERIYLLPAAPAGAWDASGLVFAAVQAFTNRLPGRAA